MKQKKLKNNVSVLENRFKRYTLFLLTARRAMVPGTPATKVFTCRGRISFMSESPATTTVANTSQWAFDDSSVSDDTPFGDNYRLSTK